MLIVWRQETVIQTILLFLQYFLQMRGEMNRCIVFSAHPKDSHPKKLNLISEMLLSQSEFD